MLIQAVSFELTMLETKVSETPDGRLPRSLRSGCSRAVRWERAGTDGKYFTNHENYAASANCMNVEVTFLDTKTEIPQRTWMVSWSRLLTQPMNLGHSLQSLVFI